MGDVATRMKQAAARAAVALVEPGSVIGVGSGTTAWAFVEALAAAGLELRGAVAASVETETRLVEAGIRVIAPESLLSLPLYVDGADAVDGLGRAIKGRGGAMVREKVLATWAERWVCVVDESKVVDRLGVDGASVVPVPVELVPFALAAATRTLAAHRGVPVLREGFVSDNGNPVLDVNGLDLDDPLVAEAMLDALPGAVGNGIFARRRVDLLLVGRSDGEVAHVTPLPQ